MSADQLPSWREAPAKQSIVEFVAAVADAGSPDFGPVRDRVAVFDNDGTLWTEQPVYAQLVSAQRHRPDSRCRRRAQVDRGRHGRRLGRRPSPRGLTAPGT
jgi:hypothetical protein